MKTLILFAPNQTPRYPVAVYWADEVEHYIASCDRCEWESEITCDRWQARVWALAHKCPHPPAWFERL